MVDTGYVGGRNIKRRDFLQLGAGEGSGNASRRIFGELQLQSVYTEYEKIHLSTLKSKRSYQENFKNHILPRLGEHTLSSITPLTIEHMKSDLIDSGLAPGTIKLIMAILKGFFTKAISWGYCTKNPVSYCDMPKVDNKRLRYLSREEAKKLLDFLSLHYPDWHDMSLLSLHTGLRISDIFRLQGRHIDFTSGIINVVGSKSGTYTAYMDQHVSDMLKKRFVSPDRLIFPGRNGGIRNQSYSFQLAVKKCGFNDGVTDRKYRVCFHTLRHTFASWLVQEGVPITVVSALMGHHSIQMTERYAKLAQENKRAAADVIAKLLN